MRGFDGVTAATGQRHSAKQQHGHVHRAGDQQGQCDVPPLRAEQSRQWSGEVAVRSVPVDGERRMQVDRVGHDGGAEHRCHEGPRVAVGHGRPEAGERGSRIRCPEPQRTQEAQRHHRQQRADPDLEHPLAPRPQPPQDQDRDDPHDDASRPHRQSEQQVEAQCPADDLGQIGGDGDHEGLEAVAPGQGLPVAVSGEAVAHRLRQGTAGDQAEFGRLVLDHHRHQRGDRQNPHQGVAVPGARAQVGRDVAGIDVGDTGHERRAEHGRSAGRHPCGAAAVGVRGEHDGGRVHAAQVGAAAAGIPDRDGCVVGSAGSRGRRGDMRPVDDGRQRRATRKCSGSGKWETSEPALA